MTTLTITVTNFAANVLMRKLENEGVKVSAKQIKSYNKPTMSALLHAISNKTEISHTNILSKCRKKEYVYPRHLFCYLSIEVFAQQFTLKQLGLFLGGRDHSTILHGREAIKNALFFKDEYAKNIQRDIDAILNLINS